MKLIKILTALAFAVSIMASPAFAADKAAADKVPACCAKAKKEGKECSKKCCVAAKKEGKACEKCLSKGKK